MPWQNTSPDVYQALLEQKSILARHTQNKSATAEIIGVRPSAVDGWCDVGKMNPNMPLGLVSRHPAARELLEYHAAQIGYTLIPAQEQECNGQVDDELMSSMKELGQVAESIQAALNDHESPGRVDGREASIITAHARRLQQTVSKLLTELDKIIAPDASV